MNLTWDLDEIKDLREKRRVYGSCAGRLCTESGTNALPMEIIDAKQSSSCESLVHGQQLDGASDQSLNRIIMAICNQQIILYNQRQHSKSHADKSFVGTVDSVESAMQSMQLADIEIPLMDMNDVSKLINADNIVQNQQLKCNLKLLSESILNQWMSKHDAVQNNKQIPKLRMEQNMNQPSSVSIETNNCMIYNYSQTLDYIRREIQNAYFGSGLKTGSHLTLYPDDPLLYHASSIVHSVGHEPSTFRQLLRWARLAEKVNKNVVVCNQNGNKGDIINDNNVTPCNQYFTITALTKSDFKSSGRESTS
ncbi:hypothetical protein MIR68_003294 [Amoeboaphelidium protococcarum]|nr:hypothetical protein MIR68_003294 [Amoeboaphelidium protococcarum]